tara:strand:- start:21 stop:551 length:531 start_codon:yes stop_codon:yes gene_type:complete
MLTQSQEINSSFVAKDFKLLGVDKKYYTLNSIKGSKATLICFICNHCPYVKEIIYDLVKETNELRKYGISSVAIMPNDVNTYPEDSFENMILFSKSNKFNIPYLYDEEQNIAKSYNAICTPDFFGFDENLVLKYRGRINNPKNKNDRELFSSMLSIANKKDIPFNNPSIGCSIKWK